MALYMHEQLSKYFIFFCTRMTMTFDTTVAPFGHTE